jgi:hypothetical protein
VTEEREDSLLVTTAAADVKMPLEMLEDEHDAPKQDPIPYTKISK